MIRPHQASEGARHDQLVNYPSQSLLILSLSHFQNLIFPYLNDYLFSLLQAVWPLHLLLQFRLAFSFVNVRQFA